MSSFPCLTITFLRSEEDIFFFFFCQFCIDERIGYRTRSDSFEKHESLFNSHIIKLLFWGIQFKCGLSSALVGEIELPCLRTLFDSSQFKESIGNKTWDLSTIGGSEFMICLWSSQGDAQAPCSSPKWVSSSAGGCKIVEGLLEVCLSCSQLSKPLAKNPKVYYRKNTNCACNNRDAS